MSDMTVARSSVRSVLLLHESRDGRVTAGLFAAAVRAQTTSATVVGTLTDSSGARIAGGTVSIKDLATGIEHSTTTDAQGEYVIPDLPGGTLFRYILHGGLSAVRHVGC